MYFGKDDDNTGMSVAILMLHFSHSRVSLKDAIPTTSREDPSA